jgi:hypothetical protein
VNAGNEHVRAWHTLGMAEERHQPETIDEQPGSPVTVTGQRSLIENRSRRPIAIAIALFAGALVVTFLLIRSGGDDAATLDATKITLELSYPVDAAPIATLNGQPGAASDGATIACRATSGKQRIGQGEAGDDGAFDVPLDAAQWPLDALTRENYTTLNQTLECRAGTGDWVQPLRQPRVKIN